MKKILGTFALCALLASPAMAAFQGPGSDQAGGFTGPGVTAAGSNATTVEKAKTMHDDSIVTLTGNIVSKQPGSKDKYMFRDATGDILVEIDHKRFMGKDVTPANTVRITGEVDKDFGKAIEIDVKNLEVVN